MKRIILILGLVSNLLHSAETNLVENNLRSGEDKNESKQETLEDLKGFGETSKVVLSCLNKMTAQVKRLELAVGEEGVCGDLIIVVKSAYKDKSYPTGPARAFVEIQRINPSQKDKQLIFKGWMFSEFPSFNPLEDPTYDVWLKDSKEFVENR